MPNVPDPRDILLGPVISEKSYGLLDDGKYTFLVREDANKTQIRIAVEQVFNVRVTSVNTLNRPGKRKRNRRSFTYGKRTLKIACTASRISGFVASGATMNV